MRVKDIDRDRYRHVMRPHTPAERAALREAIAADGCREPLAVAILDGVRYLIDGYQRLAVCEELGVTPDLTELAFGCEDDLLAWMERHSRGRRNQGKTEKDYYIGGRHMREKGPQGGDRRGKKNKLSGCQFDPAAQSIAKQEGCSESHVYRCAKMAQTINQLNVEALRPIKWAILSEQVKYGKAWVDEVVYLGAGSDEVQALLAEIAKGEPVPPKRVKELLGMDDGGGAIDEFDPLTTPIARLEPLWDRCPDARARRKMLHSVETWLASVRGLAGGEGVGDAADA